MKYWKFIDSPLGCLTLMSDNGVSLSGLWLDRQKYHGRADQSGELIETELQIFTETIDWLQEYFSGVMPKGKLSVNPQGTVFRKRIWHLLQTIPYGETVTYQQLAEAYNHRYPQNPTAPRAVGGAVGHNPVSIIIPCHRVVGRDGSLTGYAGGIQRKQFLLDLEQKGKKRDFD